MQRLHRSDGGSRARVWRRRPCDRDPARPRRPRAQPRRRRRLGVSAVLRRCGRHAPARLGAADRRPPRRGRCARGRAGHERRSARVEPGRPRVLPDLGSSALRPRGHDRRRGVRALGGGPPTLRSVPRRDRRRRVRPHAVRPTASAFASTTRPSASTRPNDCPISSASRPGAASADTSSAALSRARRARADDEVVRQRRSGASSCDRGSGRPPSLCGRRASRRVVAPADNSRPSTTTSGSATRRRGGLTGAEVASARAVPNCAVTGLADKGDDATALHRTGRSNCPLASLGWNSRRLYRAHMIKVGVVGLGKMGLSHYALIHAHPEVEAIACDSSKYVLGVLEKNTGASGYGDYETMLAEADLDAVVIATPVQRPRADGAGRLREGTARLLRKAADAEPGGFRRADGAGARARPRHPGRIPQPIRRGVPRGAGAARRRRDRRGHAHLRRGLRAGRSEAEGRYLAQQGLRGRRLPLRLRRPRDQPDQLVLRRADRGWGHGAAEGVLR